MNCEICLEIYDKSERKPMTVIPCGHTFCLMCLDMLKSTDAYVCAQCNEPISEHKPSYAVLKIIEQNILVDYKDIKLRQSVHQLVNQVNELKTSILLVTEKKLQDNQYKINALKNEISNQTTDLMNMLLNNQEKIVNDASCYHARLVSHLRRDSPEDEKYINDIELRDLTNTDRAELSGIKMKLNNMRSNLVFKSNILNEIDLSLESNNVPFNYDVSQTGEIICKEFQTRAQTTTTPEITQSTLNSWLPEAQQPNVPDTLPPEMQLQSVLLGIASPELNLEDVVPLPELNINEFSSESVTNSNETQPDEPQPQNETIPRPVSQPLEPELPELPAPHAENPPQTASVINSVTVRENS